MADWRKMEADLIRQLDAAGISIVYISGIPWAVVASFDGCNKPHACEAVLGDRGRVKCDDCGMQGNINAEITAIDISKLARSLTE